MESFTGKIAVITGGGDGMGRSLAVALATEGCHVAICDIAEDGMAGTVEQARAEAPDGTRITSLRCDVSEEEQLFAFRDAVQREHETDHVHLVFNNAGVGGGGSMVVDQRPTWERAFAINWGGVYLGTRTFLPLLVASDGGHLVNTSSVNGFWASLGPERPHTSYSAAKFAVKGFTEALVQDLRLNAPHVQAHVVMPGHIGTGITVNTLAAHGMDSSLRPEITEAGAAFRNNAPTTSNDAATVILDGVREGRWRILIGDDAHVLDMLVREEPERAYERDFLDRMRAQGVLAAVTD